MGPNCDPVGSQIIQVLNSKQFVNSCPKVSPFRFTDCSMQFLCSRPTKVNLYVVEAAIVLNLHLKILTDEEVRHGLNAYMLICKESHSELMDFCFDKIQRAFRVSLDSSANFRIAVEPRNIAQNRGGVVSEVQVAPELSRGKTE